MSFSPIYQRPNNGDSFIGSLCWTLDADTSVKGVAYVFRGESGDVFFIDKADETGAVMDESSYTFSELPSQGIYEEFYRLDAASAGIAATPWTLDGSPVGGIDGLIGSNVIIPGGYQNIKFREGNGTLGSVVEIYTAALGVGDPMVFNTASGEIDLIQAAVGEQVLGDKIIRVTSGAIFITVAREV